MFKSLKDKIAVEKTKTATPQKPRVSFTCLNRVATKPGKT